MDDILNSGTVLPFMAHGIDQVALIVENLDKAMQKFSDRLGVGPWRIYTYGKPLVKKMAYRGQPADFAMRIALSSIGALNIELIEMIHGETIYAEYVAKHGYGLHHWGIFVDDMGAALAEAAARGIEVIQEGSGFGLDGSGHYAYLDTEDSMGIVLELIELPKVRAAPERIFPAPDGQGGA